jgi:sec-independent protein translocase protein TatA
MMIIMVIALIVVGPHKLPELARSLGKGLAEFKNASNDFRKNIEEESRSTDVKEQTTVETMEKVIVETAQPHEANPNKA